MIPINWLVAGPALYVAIGALLALMIDAFLSRRSWFFPAFALAAGVIAGFSLAHADADFAETLTVVDSVAREITGGR